MPGHCQTKEEIEEFRKKIMETMKDAHVRVPEPEKVNHPKHYGGDTTYEVIKVLKAWLTPEEFRGWLKGTVIKYLPRAGHKSGESELVDLRKASWYLDYWVKEIENGEGKMEVG